MTTSLLSWSSLITTGWLYLLRLGNGASAVHNFPISLLFGVDYFLIKSSSNWAIIVFFYDLLMIDSVQCNSSDHIQWLRSSFRHAVYFQHCQTEPSHIAMHWLILEFIWLILYSVCCLSEWEQWFRNTRYKVLMKINLKVLIIEPIIKI